MSVGADKSVKVVSPRERLNHRDVDPLRQTASAAAESSNRLRRDVEELGKPFGPLIDEGLAVDEDKSGPPAGGDQVRREHGLAPPRGCAHDADVIPEGCAGGSALRLAELAAKFELERFATDAFVVHIELDAEFPNQGSDIGQTAARESQVALKIFKATDDARRAGDRQPHPLEFGEHRVGERCESPDRVGERWGKLRSIDVDAIGQGRFDRLGQPSLAQSFSQSSRRAPRWVARVGGWAYSERSVVVAAGDEFS